MAAAVREAMDRMVWTRGAGTPDPRDHVDLDQTERQHPTVEIQRRRLLISPVLLRVKELRAPTLW